MNKAELVDAISSKTKLTKADARKALDAFLEAAVDALKRGEKVAMIGFGTFSVVERAARTGRNPRTGDVLKVAEKKVVKFKPGAELSDMVK